MKKILWGLIAFLMTTVSFAGSVDLSWTNAVKNTDGSTIPTSCQSGVTQCGKLVSTRVEHGSCSAPNVFGTKAGEVVVNAPASSTTISNLGPGSYCFRGFHKSDFNVESAVSNVTSKTIAAPIPNPPGNLTVTDLTAFQIIMSKDKFAMIPVGTVSAGTVCDSSQSVNGYYAVPRTAVSFFGSVKPQVVVARCAG